MSILLETGSGWIISHEKFFDRLAVEVPEKPRSISSSDPDPDIDIDKDDGVADKPVQEVEYFRLNPNLFKITHPFKDNVSSSKSRTKARKPSKGLSSSTSSSKLTLDFLDLSDTTKLVKHLGEGLLGHPGAKAIFNTDDKDKDLTLTSKNVGPEEDVGPWPRNNLEAVAASQRFFETIKDLKWPQFHGHNPDPDLSVISEVNGCMDTEAGGSLEEEGGHRFIFPPGSTFYCNDVSEMGNIFQSVAVGGTEEEGEKFDLVVIDPPWWNKFIRRKKRKQHEAGYEMIDNAGIAALPIKNILKDDGLVALWCTNAKSNQDAVLNEIFPAWDVHFCRMLHWLKVTKSGVPVCPFNVETKKQPYEAIIIGARRNSPLVKLKSFKSFQSSDAGSKILISVPSSINSHKPPLIDVLRRLYPNHSFDKKLEVFARYLTPGFTSFGNEVIKLQHISLFEKLSR